jgi:NAD(P)-dependent dehydrogenase (short-subunit alcohol dehydrogenase family)
MTMSIDLSGRVVLVTGGAKGIGLGIARSFLAVGATVATCGRSDVADPPGASHYVCDVRDPELVARMVDRLLDDHGRFDVLVNNAGGGPYAPVAESSSRLHDKLLDLNLKAALTCSQAANAVMQDQESGGAIVNVSSVSATRPSPGTAVYGAAKAGLDSLTTSLAIEWAPKVRLNAINVGLCRTENTDDHYGDDETVATIERTIPMGRMARPEEVGHVAVFLASDLASYVSGARVACHGGGETPVFLHVVSGQK